MNIEEKLKIRDAQIRELYEKVGEFAVKFEHVCHAMQTAVAFILQMEGLQNKQITNILLAGHTAEPLRRLFESLVGELVDANNTEKKIITNIFSRIQKLTTDRNNIIHSTWYIGWSNSVFEDMSWAPGYKLHKDKKGAALKTFKYKSEDFSAYIDEAEIIASLIKKLHTCVIFRLSIEKNFAINKSGEVVELGIENNFPTK